ncbi:hypothetical protein NMY22_g15732 [Coprinellus aureogranulatus]|nr:hypothetical protein NMY22_g15732 [Coprinellus aureogranulatus]
MPATGLSVDAMDKEHTHYTALYPLTPFDKIFERTTFVTGWLVEGKINANVVEEALRRVTNKWRMLAGNEMVPPRSARPSPAEYKTFTLTTSTSNVPITNYTSIPIPQFSNSLPPEVFIDPSTPLQYTQWESTQHPLTSWHITYFPGSTAPPSSVQGWSQEDYKAYTAIGFARSHGVFDGVGASLVMRALIAEINGKPWPVPPPLTPGVNVNPIVRALEREENPAIEGAYRAFTPAGFAGFWKMARERYWGGVTRRICLLPRDAFAHLVEGVKSESVKKGHPTNSVSSGDVLTAWLYKTLYADGVSPSTIVHITNFASFRLTLANENAPTDPIMSYPHNAFTPLPYPALPASEIRAFSLQGLSTLLATARQSLSKAHVAAAYKKLRTPHIPAHPDAQDSVTVSNVSASRILESDWTAAGAKRTLCGYRYQMTPTGVVLANAVYIAGRLDDGSIVLDVTLNSQKMKLLELEVQRLTKMMTPRSPVHPHPGEVRIGERRVSE